MMEKFRRQGVLRLAAAAIATLWFASAGCEPALQDGPIPPLEPARGKADISEAIAALEAHRARIGPLRAGGNARVEFYEPDGQKRPPENPNIQVRLVPPDLLFFRGEILGNELVRSGRIDAVLVPHQAEGGEQLLVGLARDGSQMPRRGC